MSIITFSDQIGSYGAELARRLSRKLAYDLLTPDDILQRFFEPKVSAHDLHLLRESPKHFLNEMDNNLSFKDYLDGSLNEFADRQPAILLGLGSWLWLATIRMLSISESTRTMKHASNA